MMDGDGRVRLEVARPPDRMIRDRIWRTACRVAWALRTPLFLSLGLLRHRERRPPSPARVSRLLVIRTDRIGDLALTTPALADLRAHFSKAEITVLASAAPLEILREHPAVDHLRPLEGGRLPADLVGRFDLVIDFTPDEDLKGALLARAARARHSAGFRASGRQACFSLRGARADRRKHILELNRDLLDALGVPATSTRPALYLTREERGSAQAILSARGAAAPRVAVHPGGPTPSQRWSAERFAELISLLTERRGAACVVVAGPCEQDLTRRICAATPDAVPAGVLSIRDMMGVIGACDLFIGNNSGPLHVAGALGVPTVSVMGPTDTLRFSPRGFADRVLRRELPCSPCQRARCWHHTCLRSIEADEVCEQAEAALSARLPREKAL
ncbi:MAG TPA: glycosyltransferase family 9 protein [Candidatus Polarisedimenticolia bacterium]|nr:glycosyltransferase family 9 protein [Candidatus Polarisedimenticolia bacterium]